MLRNMSWNNLFARVAWSRFVCRCTECGTPWPCFKAAGYSIEPFKWTCSPACFDAHVDAIIERASPAEDEPFGATWDTEDVDAFLANAGHVPSMRLKLERAMETARSELRLDELP